MPSRVAILILLVLPVLADEVVGLPYVLEQDGQTTRGVLAPPNQDHRLSMGSEDDQPFLSMTLAPDEHRGFVLSEGALDLHPRHMYEVTATIRRPAGTFVVLQRHGDPNLHLPPIDYQIMPLWEDISTFMIVPDEGGETTLVLTGRKLEQCQPEVSIDIQLVQLTDLGQVRMLPEPVTIWDYAGPYEVQTSGLVVLPGVLRDASSGIYRLRCQVETPWPVTFVAILEQGDTKRLMRSSAYGHRFDLEEGTHQVECLFYVADRMFIHQWMRAKLVNASLPATLTNVVLEQIAIEPEAAKQARTQTPARR